MLNYPGYPALIPQLAVTLTRFILGWDSVSGLLLNEHMKILLRDFSKSVQDIKQTLRFLKKTYQKLLSNVYAATKWDIKRNITVGDVVIVKDKNSMRGDW